MHCNGDTFMELLNGILTPVGSAKSRGEVDSLGRLMDGVQEGRVFEALP